MVVLRGTSEFRYRLFRTDDVNQVERRLKLSFRFLKSYFFISIIKIINIVVIYIR